MFILQKQAKIEKIQEKINSNLTTLNKKKSLNLLLCFFIAMHETRKHGTAGTGQTNVPYLQTHSRDGTVPCFQRENTGQPGRDNPMLRIYRHTAGTGLSRVFNEKTRDSWDGTIQCPVFTDTQPGRDCPVFSTRKHGTAGKGRGHWIVPSRLSRVFSLKTRNSRDGTIQCLLFSDRQPGRDCPVFSTRKHGTAGTGRNFFLVPFRPGVPDFSIEHHFV